MLIYNIEDFTPYLIGISLYLQFDIVNIIEKGRI